MIPTNVIDEWFSKASAKMDVVFIAADQDLQDKNRPDYPYGTYKVLSETERPAREHEKAREIDPDDNTKVRITTGKRSVASISVNILGVSGTPELTLLLNEFSDFIDDLDYKDKQNIEYYNELFDELDINPVSPSPEDRTIFLGGTQYEYKLGYDIEFQYNRKVIKSVEGMSRIEVDNETTGDKIIVDTN